MVSILTFSKRLIVLVLTMKMSLPKWFDISSSNTFPHVLLIQYLSNVSITVIVIWLKVLEVFLLYICLEDSFGLCVFTPIFSSSKIKFTFVTAVGVWVLILIYFKVWFKFGNCRRLLTFISGGVFWSSMKWVLIDRQVAMEIAVTAETRALFCTLPLSGKGLWDILKIV